MSLIFLAQILVTVPTNGNKNYSVIGYDTIQSGYQHVRVSYCPLIQSL